MNIFYVGKDYGKLKYINTLGNIIHAGYMQKTMDGKKQNLLGSLCGQAIDTVRKSFDGVDANRMKEELKDRLCKECKSQLTKQTEGSP